MKQLTLVIFLSALLGASGSALAKKDSHHWKPYQDGGSHHGTKIHKGPGFHWNGDGCGEKDSPPVTAVPELDAGGAALALALMGALISVVRERRRARS